MSQASDRLALYLTAEAAALEGKKFEIEGRMLSMEDLVVIRQGIVQLGREVKNESPATRSPLGARYATFA